MGKIILLLTFAVLLLSSCGNASQKGNQKKNHHPKIVENCKTVRLSEEVFGTYNNETVKKFTWSTDCGFSLSAISYGAIIQSIKFPDKHGVTSDVVLGFDDIQGYVEKNTPYFGSTLGRCANRIGGAEFSIDGVVYHLYANDGRNSLHGGKVGFNKKYWNTTVEGTKVHFSYYSRDGEEDYPGDLVTTVTYELKDGLSFHVEFVATTNKKTVVNLANHSYFNLAGQETGAAELYNHYVTINADKITETDSESIPTGRFIEVGGTAFDLRTEKRVGDFVNDNSTIYDNNFCVNRWGNKGLNWVSRAIHPSSGRFLEVYSNQPGLQFYTANSLPAANETAIVGKGGVGYRRHGAFSFETQNYPDAINHKNFPNEILSPGEVYRHKVVYNFGVDTSDSKVVEQYKHTLTASIPFPPAFNDVVLSEGGFGRLNQETVKKFTWETPSGFSVTVITYGAIIQAIKMPDKQGITKDIVLGFDDLQGYVTMNTPDLTGCVVGRCANRIADGTFRLGDEDFQLTRNLDGKHHLHGGFKGFDKVNWKSTTDGAKVILSHLSKDGDQGYPGDLMINISYEVTPDDTLRVEYTAVSNKTTVVNLTNHSYFNLGGHDSGALELYEHRVVINSEKILEGDNDWVPTGNFLNVGGTPFDLRTATRLGDVISNGDTVRFHHNFIVDRYGCKDAVTLVGRVQHPSGRYLEVRSNQPSVVFYTGNFIQGMGHPDMVGKGGAVYHRCGGLCLEPMNLVDAVHHQHFPSPLLKPGDVYRNVTVYSFGVA